MPARIDRFAALAIAAALIVPAAQTATAAEVSKADRDAIASVITGQIDAFGRKDAAKAESFAVPAFKTTYPDPEKFLAMVNRAYAPLINPRSTHFDDITPTAVGLLQKVTVIDNNGSVWTALYSFQRVDGEWRINGCALVKEKTTVI